jgi:hypothetical protein
MEKGQEYSSQSNETKEFNDPKEDINLQEEKEESSQMKKEK